MVFLKKKKLGLLGMGVCAVVVCVLCLRCNYQKETIARTMMGKSKAEVLDTLGHPWSREDYDYAHLRRTRHTKAEVDQWKASTLSYGFVYGDVVVQFNINDTVVAIRDR